MRDVSNLTKTAADVSGFDEEQLQVLAAYEQFTDAMVHNDTARLDALMEPGARCRHAGRRMQPRQTWFDEMKTGFMHYRGATITAIDIQLDGAWAIVEPIVKIDANIWGMSKIWTMSITTHMHRSRG